MNLDLVAMHYMPPDMAPGLAHVQTEGDGNCFLHTVSYLLYKSQEMYTEMQVHIIYETVGNTNI